LNEILEEPLNRLQTSELKGNRLVSAQKTKIPINAEGELELVLDQFYEKGLKER
jgi:hypothetical protein